MPRLGAEMEDAVTDHSIQVAAAHNHLAEQVAGVQRSVELLPDVLSTALAARLEKHTAASLVAYPSYTFADMLEDWWWFLLFGAMTALLAGAAFGYLIGRQRHRTPRVVSDKTPLPHEHLTYRYKNADGKTVKEPLAFTDRVLRTRNGEQVLQSELPAHFSARP